VPKRHTDQISISENGDSFMSHPPARTRDRERQQYIAMTQDDDHDREQWAACACTTDLTLQFNAHFHRILILLAAVVTSRWMKILLNSWLLLKGMF